MPIRPTTALIAGALLVAALSIVGGIATSEAMIGQMEQAADKAIADAGGTGVKAKFTSDSGWPTRHPLLSGGDKLNEATRAKVARAVAAIPGVGGVRWADGSIMAQRGEVPLAPMHCQDDVQALLRARTVRFEESSSAIDPASSELLDEVAAALRPCLGSIIAITGHTDSSGSEPGNIELSALRATSVENELVRRGIPRDGLRAEGVGSQQPVEGLDPADPANRRIEFSVIATVPLAPTPIDTPSAH